MSNYKSTIQEYLSNLEKFLKTGDAKEHTYRPAFQHLIEQLTENIQVINEPAYTGGNAPDFLFKRGDTPIAYAECKDIDIDISKKEVQEQAKRYVDAFGKILLTNYIDLEIIDENGSVVKISIAKLDNNKNLEIFENKFEAFADIVRDYMTTNPQTIKSAKKLAKIMAGKAKILRDNARASLDQNESSDIYKQYRTFQEVLIRDLSKEEFADMYAQTLVYGLFVARYYDPTLPTFSRYEAQDLLPATNPLLKKFFGHVAGTDYDQKIAWIVDSLIETYLSADVAGIMHKEFVKKSKDPVLHFYETFLTEYDKGLRKSRGVYYTPEPVVSFIVRSVDQILKSKFGLAKGLADTSKIPHTKKVQAGDGRTKDGVKQLTEDIHKVQILDPAVGTGTFLNEVIHEIHKGFVGQEGMWTGYVKEHLLPRLHGFELMMASYTMAHLKLGVTLNELGYKGEERLSVWLTNSLEQGVHEVPNLFMSEWLTEESNKASYIKSDLPIMVVIGNPPYAVSSVNKGIHIQSLIQDYKKDLNERKINLDDDYIKFIRFAEDQIAKNGTGVVAMITNNSFIDGITHRQMRKHLMETFDEIYVLDLHGNSKKKETALDGGKDENVFNIMQGVSINIFVKTEESKEIADVYHAELFGKREEKFENLNTLDFDRVSWGKLDTSKPYYFFVPKDFETEGEYNKGFSITEILNEYNSGVQTKNDSLAVTFDKKYLEQIISKFQNLTIEELKKQFPDRKESSGWNFHNAKEDLLKNPIHFTKILYRPFDFRHTIFTGFSGGFIGRPREKTMIHVINKDNLGLSFMRQIFRKQPYCDIFVSKFQNQERTFYSNRGATSFAPLYLYADDGTKVPNLDKKIWQKINEIVGETTPEDVLDYIYAVLHSPSYREKYQEFLKIDFPRVPYPEDKDIFWKLVGLGRELREIHLLESSKVTDFITTFPEGGSNRIEKGYPKYRAGLKGHEKLPGQPVNLEGSDVGDVWINDEQHFGNVPEVAWDFYIGGYQPAQKWLKDRRERELSIEDIEHYQKIIVALTETDRFMGEIDGIVKFD